MTKTRAEQETITAKELAAKHKLSPRRRRVICARPECCEGREIRVVREGSFSGEAASTHQGIRYGRSWEEGGEEMKNSSTFTTNSPAMSLTARAGSW
jgi:hypothetical protein